jgi:hypothetical protein
MWCTFVVDGGSESSGTRSGFGEANGGGSLHPQCGFVLVQLAHLGVEGYLLAGKLIMVLSCQSPVINLPGAGLCLLLLLVSLLLIGKELHSWQGYRHLHRDCRHGLENRSVL